MATMADRPDRGYTGTIVPIGDPNGNAAPLGRLGPVTLEAIRDGLSNTALFSEKLHGLQGKPDGLSGPGDGKRGIFNGATGAGVGAGARRGAPFVQSCRSLPGTTASLNSDHIGNQPCRHHPWHVGMVSYNHVGPPNSINCQDPGRELAGYVGPSGSCPPSSNHPGGVHITFADGSVRFIKDSINQQIWWAIGTRNGKEIVSSDAL